MKIPPLKTKITNYIGKAKYIINEQKFLNDFVHIDTNINADALKQLYPARKGIANYAFNKGVAVSISDAEKFLKVSVTDLLRGKEKIGRVPSDVNATTIHTVPYYFIIDYSSDGVQLVRKTKHEYEDSFIRTIYRTIENSANELNPKK